MRTMRWKDTLFCRTRNDRGFIARCMFTSESKKKDFPLSSEWFGVCVFCRKKAKKQHIVQL